MGARGLYTILRAFMSFLPLAALADSCVGFDASFLIHVILARHALAILQYCDWTGFEREVDATIEYLRKLRITPLFVFDGRRDPLKTANVSRAESRSRAYLELQMKSKLVEELCVQLQTSSDELIGALEEEDAVAAGGIALRQGSAAQALQEMREASQKMAAAAIGSRAAEAAERMRAILRDYEISFEVALYEAESHLRMLQTTGKVGAVIAFDADYVTIGTDYALMDPAWRYGGGLTFIKARVPHLAQQLIASTNPESRMSQWARIVERFGPQCLRQTSYFLRNDYTHLNKVGEGTVRAAWIALVQSTDAAAEAAPPGEPYIAPLPTISAVAAEVHKAARLDAQTQYTAADMAKTAQHAAFMFHHQLVVQDGKAVRQPLPRDCEGCVLVYDAEANTLSGAELDPYFNTCTPDGLQQWLAGDFNVSGDVFGQPALIDGTRSSAVPEATVPPAYLSEETIKTMRLPKLKELALQRGLQSVSGMPLKELRAALLAHFAAAGHVFASPTALGITGPSLSEADLNEERVKAADKLAERARDVQWAPLPTTAGLRWSISEAVTTMFLASDKIDNRNAVELQQHRQVLNIECALGKEIGAWDGMANYVLYEAFIRGDVQSSMPSDLFRNVYVQSLVAQESTTKAITILSLPDVCCMPPRMKVKRGSVASASQPTDSASQSTAAAALTTDEKLCRGGRNCLHTVALVSRVQEASSLGSTDGACAWKRPQKDFTFPPAPFIETLATLLPGSHHLLRRGQYFALHPDDVDAILQGIGVAGDVVYKAAYDRFRTATLKAYEEASDSQRLQGIPLASRGLRADIVTGHGRHNSAVHSSLPRNQALLGDGARPQVSARDPASGAAASAAASSLSRDGQVVVDTEPAASQAATSVPSASAALGVLTAGSAPAAPPHGTKATAAAATSTPKVTAAKTKSSGDRDHGPSAKREPASAPRPCICAAGAECKSIDGGSRFRLPTDADQKAKWICALYPNSADQAQRDRLKAQSDARLYAGHFKIGLLSGGEHRRRLPPGTLPDAVGRRVHPEKLEQVIADKLARKIKCVCSQSEELCGELAVENMALFSHPSNIDLARRWLRVLCPKDSDVLREASLNGGFLVAAHHFLPDQLTSTITNQYGSFQRPSGDALPRFVPYSEDEVSHSSKRSKTSASVKNARQLLPPGARDDSATVAKVAELFDQRQRLEVERERLLQRVRELELSLAEDPATPAAGSFATGQLRALFIQRLTDDASHCHRFTGQHSFAVLRALYDYINARGALDHVLWYREDNPNQARRTSAAGRPRLLSTFEAFVFFLCVLRRETVRAMCAFFEVEDNTGQRTYVTMLNAVTFILSTHQPWPLLEDVARFTPLEARAHLQFDDATAVFLADCVERPVMHPALPELQFLLWSDYKHHHTFKHLAVAACNGYICELTPAYPGRIRDNEIIAHSAVGERLAGKPERKHLPGYDPDDPPSIPVALLFDKGYTQVTSVQEHGPFVYTPRTKRRGQLNFEAEANISKKVAKFRAPVEVLFANAATYAAFKRSSDVGSADLADLAAQAIRCLCNLTPPAMDWAVKSNGGASEAGGAEVEPDVSFD